MSTGLVGVDVVSVVVVGADVVLEPNETDVVVSVVDDVAVV